MRPALRLIAAGLVLASAGQALAASQPPAKSSPGSMTSGPATGPTTSTPDTGAAPTTATTPDTSTTPSTPPAANSAASSGANTSATTPGFTTGEAVKDNTGATIGAISSLTTGANGQQMAVIKMGNDTFEVPADRLGSASGAATINLSQAQIASMVHGGATGAPAGSTGTGGTTGK